MAVGLQIKVGADVTGLMGAFQAAAGGAGSLTDTLKATVATMSPIGGVAVAAADAIAGFTQAAAEDRAEQEKLAAVYATATGGLEGNTEAIDAAIKAGAEKAFSDSEVRAGLQSLIVATGDAAAANELLVAAQDLSRFSGASLEDASKALSKAYLGNDAALRKLVPGLEKGATASDTITAAMALSTGQADLFAASTEGVQKKGSDAFSELGETIGSAFLPVLDAIMPLMGPIVEIIGELITAVLPLLKPAIMIVVGALKIFLQVLQTLIGVIKEVMKFIGDLVQKAQDAVNFVGSIDLNPFSAIGLEGGTPQGRRGRSARSGGGGGGGSTVNVNVQSADPTEVMRAIRRWSRNNGGSGPFTRGLDRSTG